MAASYRAMLVNMLAMRLELFQLIHHFQRTGYGHHPSMDHWLVLKFILR
jgi:hypothetical protein